MAKSSERIIKDSIAAIITQPSYKTWLKGLKSTSEDDVIQLNNSFLYRDQVSTEKNNKYLGFSIFNTGHIKEYYILEGSKINSDFKYLSKKQIGTDVIAIKLIDAIKLERKTLGKLIYILIGVLDENVTVEQEVHSTLLKRFVLNPTSKPSLSIKGDTIYLSDASDEDYIWSEIHKHFTGITDFDTKEESIKQLVGHALDAIESKSYSTLRIPDKLSTTGKTVTESLIDVLDKQITEYKIALSKCKGDPNIDKDAFNEILRVSYNFSSDALTFISLIVSICDLKPLILWGTLNKHYELAEMFKKLPWVRSKRKASLNNYRRIIGGARNSTFHNLFPFKRSIDIELPDKTIRQATLRIFSEFTNRKENQLRFQDKELIDVLIEFTRTNEHRITPSFWQKNLDVLTATKDLFSETTTFLKQVYKESK